MVNVTNINQAGRFPAQNRSKLNLAKKVVSSLEDVALQGRWFTYVDRVDGPTEVLVEHQSIPWHKTQPTARYTSGMFRHYPGPVDVDGIQIVFYETWDYRVTKWLNYWRSEVYDPETGVFGTPTMYRREFVTEFYPPNSESSAMRRSYLGCFPIEQQPFELSYAEVDGRITVSGLFAVNKVATTFYAYSAAIDMVGDLPPNYQP